MCSQCDPLPSSFVVARFLFLVALLGSGNFILFSAAFLTVAPMPPPPPLQHLARWMLVPTAWPAFVSFLRYRCFLCFFYSRACISHLISMLLLPTRPPKCCCRKPLKLRRSNPVKPEPWLQLALTTAITGQLARWQMQELSMLLLLIQVRFSRGMQAIKAVCCSDCDERACALADGKRCARVEMRVLLRCIVVVLATPCC
jgi:hypothetical protein